MREFFTIVALHVAGMALRSALICFTVILPAATEKMRSAFSSLPFTCSTTSWVCGAPVGWGLLAGGRRVRCAGPGPQEKRRAALALNTRWFVHARALWTLPRQV